MPYGPSDRLRIAFDVGPLHGALTGIGRAVMGMKVALEARTDIDLHHYVLSFRADLKPGVTRLRYPAAAAIRSWGRLSWPKPDRMLGDIDIVHGTNYVVPPSKHPRVVSVYDCWALDNPQLATPMVNRSMKALARAVEGGAVIHASSHATAQSCRRHFPNVEVTVVYLGTPTTHRHTPRRISALPLAAHEVLLHAQPFILSVGTLEQRKNIVHLVKAFARCAEQQSDLALVLAGGDGDDSENVRIAVQQLPDKIQQRVVLLGRVDDESLHWLYSNALAVAYPSLDEGFGFPVLEAMSYGTPVVASKVGSIPEVAGDAALLLPCDNIDDWADALTHLASDHGERRRMVEKGHAQAARFSWESTAEGLVDIYRARMTP